MFNFEEMGPVRIFFTCLGLLVAVKLLFFLASIIFTMFIFSTALLLNSF